MVLAGFYVQNERFEEAIAMLQTARKRAPDVTDVPFQLAALYERQGQLDRSTGPGRCTRRCCASTRTSPR
jgi:hypothetical protein